MAEWQDYERSLLEYQCEEEARARARWDPLEYYWSEMVREYLKQHDNESEEAK